MIIPICLIETLQVCTTWKWNPFPPSKHIPLRNLEAFGPKFEDFPVIVHAMHENIFDYKLNHIIIIYIAKITCII